MLDNFLSNLSSDIEARQSCHRHSLCYFLKQTPRSKLSCMSAMNFCCEGTVATELSLAIICDFMETRQAAFPLLDGPRLMH